jgi:hypothetical protein
LFIWDNPETLGAEGTAAGTIECILRWERAHGGAGGDGREEAAPFRGAVDGITAVQTLAITTTATLHETRFTSVDDQLKGFTDEGFVRRVLEISQSWKSTCAGRPASAFKNASARAAHPVVVVREETEEEANQAAPEVFHTCGGTMEVSAIFVSGGSDGKVRLWRAVSYFRLVRRLEKESGVDVVRPWSIQRAMVGPTSVPAGAKSSLHVLLEPLRTLDTDIGRLCGRDLLPMHQIDQERRRQWPALHAIQCGRPWGVKAIGVDTSKVSKDHTGAICDAIISSNQQGGPNVAGFPPTSLALDVATVGGLSVKINLAGDPSQEHPAVYVPTNLRGEMITTAGHFHGPGLGMAQHPTLAGLYFTIAADKTICTWQLQTEATGKASVAAILAAAASNGVDMGTTSSILQAALDFRSHGERQILIACLPLKRLATAIAIAPQVRVERRTGDGGLPIARISILLAVGFEDGRTGEFVLELGQNMASSPFLDAIGWEEKRMITPHGRCFRTGGLHEAEFVAGDDSHAMEGSFLDIEPVTAVSYGPPPTTQLATRKLRSPAGILLAIGYRGSLRVLRSFDLFCAEEKNTGGSGCFEFTNHGAEVTSIDWSEIRDTLSEPWFEQGQGGAPPPLRMSTVLRSIDRSHAIYFHEFTLDEKSPAEGCSTEKWECWSIRKPNSTSAALQFRDAYFPSSSARVGFEVAGIWGDSKGRAKVTSVHSCGSNGSGVAAPLGGFDGGFGGGDDTALNVIGLEDGKMKIFKSPTIAHFPNPVFEAPAHVSKIVSIQSAFIPKQAEADSTDRLVSGHASLVIATFGASDTVLASWKVSSCREPRLLAAEPINNYDIGPLRVNCMRSKGAPRIVQQRLEKQTAAPARRALPSCKERAPPPRLFVPTEHRKEGTKPYAGRSEAYGCCRGVVDTSPDLPPAAEGVDLDLSKFF